MFGKIRAEFRQARGLLSFGFLQAIGQGCGMAAPLVAAKSLSQEIFGSYCLAKMIAFFFSTLFVASFQTPFIVFANQERTKRAKINQAFSSQCAFLGGSFLIVAVLSLMFLRQIAAFADIATDDVTFVILAFLGVSLKSLLCNVFMAMGQRMRSAAAELVFGLLSLGIVVGLHLTGTLTLRGVLVIYPVAGLVVVTVFLWKIDFKQLLPFSFRSQHIQEMFHFAKWIVLGSTAVYFINWGDNLVLRAYVSMGQIGSYNLAYQVFKGVLSLVFILYGYFLPFVSEHIENTEKIRGYLWVKRPRILMMGAFVILLLFAAAPMACAKAYEDQYPGAPEVFRILLIGAIFMLHVILYAPVMNALKRYRFAQTGNAVQVLLNLLLDLILVPRMGIRGAAVATTLAYFCHAVMIEIYFQVKLRRALTV